MSTHRNPKNFVLLQTVLVVIASILTVLSIIDLATGEKSISLWVGVVCWPIVIITSAYQIVRARRSE